MILPAEEIGRESLQVEAPKIFVSRRADFHAVATRGEARLDDSISIDQTLTGQGIDLKCVPHVGIQ